MLKILFFDLAVAIIGVLSLIRQYQMLQQNSYFLSRYFKWYRGAFKKDRIFDILVAVFGAVAVFTDTAPGKTDALGIIATAVLVLYLAANAFAAHKENRKSVKKIVMTARVKRMYLASAIIFAALTAVGTAVPGAVGKCASALLYVLAALPELTVVLSLTVMKPIEKAISNYYVNDAKKILASKKNMKIIGVTGSYGKTSTKFILGRILSEKYNTLITPENYNTPMGVVITVRRDLKPQTEVFVCEMGAKKKGDIAEICDIASPDTGFITSVGPQHLDTFGNIETVASTKFELADRVKQKGGTMYLCGDNEIIKEKAKDYTCVTYGAGENNDCVAENVTYSADGLKMTVRRGDISFPVTSKLLGAHSAVNIAGAAAIALDMGLTPEEIAFAVSKIKPVEHRLEMKPYIFGSTLIDDAYNSNPEGCLSAVRVLGNFTGMKKIIVTPGLVELGDREYECNKALGAEAAKYCDRIILVDEKRSVPLLDGIRSEGFDEEKVTVVKSFKEAYDVFSRECDKNTVILFENDLPDNYLG